MVSPVLSATLVWASITVAAALTVLAWQQRPKPGAGPFAVLMAAGTWLVATSSIGLFTLDPSRRLLLHTLRWPALVVIPIAWLLFALEYTSREAYVTRRTVGLLLVIPAVSLVLALVPGDHGLLYADRVVNVYGDISIVGLAYGPWFWIHTAYAYALLAAGTLLVFQLVVSTRTLYRTQALALLITVFAPWVGNVVYLTGNSPVPNFDPTPFMFLVSGGAGIAALTQFELLDSVPVSSRIARETVIERMDDGVVVVDAEDRIVDINPQAESMLGCPAGTARDTPADDIVPGYERLRDGDDAECAETVERERPDGTRYYEVSMTRLREDRESGAVVVVHDVTDRRNRVQQLDVLNRVLRHNLRNEMNVVYGYADQLENGEAAARIQKKAMTMVNLGDKAREIDRILDDEGDDESVGVEDIIEVELDRARNAHPDVAFEVVCPETDRRVPRTVGPVLRNLVENAAKHNERDDPVVSVAVRLDDETVVVEVADNGPGIPEAEQAVLRTGEETPLQHSSGLGLWLVNWGVQTMGGSVTVEPRDEGGTLVRLEVPVVENRRAAPDD